MLAFMQVIQIPIAMRSSPQAAIKASTSFSTPRRDFQKLLSKGGAKAQKQLMPS